MLMAVRMKPTMLSQVITKDQHEPSLKSNLTTSQLDLAERSLGYEQNNNSLHKFTVRQKAYDKVYSLEGEIYK